MLILIKKSKIFILFTSLFLITSCVETIVVGTLAGGAIAMREKTILDTTNDATIATKLGTKFIAEGLKNVGNSVDITVNEGRVLLTGVVRKEENINLASNLAWKVDKVKEVINEIHFKEEKNIRPRNFSNALFDYILTARVELKLAITKKVSSINYKITTVDSVVYLLGVAHNDSEIRRVLDAVSKVRGVKKVVNHIILISDSRR